MSSERNRSGSLLGNIFSTLGVLLVVLVVGAAVLLSTAQVSGSANLPSGVKVDIRSGWWGFGVSEQQSQTRITIAGRTLVFTKTSLTVDGRPITEFEDQAENLSLVSDSGGLRLVSNDDELTLR